MYSEIVVTTSLSLPHDLSDPEQPVLEVEVKQRYDKLQLLSSDRIWLIQHFLSIAGLHSKYIVGWYAHYPPAMTHYQGRLL